MHHRLDIAVEIPLIELRGESFRDAVYRKRDPIKVLLQETSNSDEVSMELLEAGELSGVRFVLSIDSLRKALEAIEKAHF